MKCAGVLFLLVIFGGTWHVSRATCVLESDFGFVINCAFKKSGLFRVRNLGGIKAHVGLGFSLGDELGFKESISNTELNNRRRSVEASKFQVQAIQAQQAQQRRNANSIVVQTPPSTKKPTQSPIKAKQLADIPPFKPIPPAAERPVVPTMIALNANKVVSTNSHPSKPTPALVGVAVPAFSKMPSSISRISAENNEKPVTVIMAVPSKQISDKLKSQNFALRTLSTAGNDIAPPVPQQTSNSIQSLLAATNLTEAALEEVLLLKHRQMLQQQAALTSTTTTTTTTTPRSPNKLANIGKVMNAPKEYYPVGYDKNFDDNFASRVELPETSFYCGDQKHFPGLYADEDLGCMVFHVCALTDDGLIMKSFLCPESTLFDQTILKCNWWFYVDCKSSKKLYDSNIPISKSYQLMKALTFFSSYKKDGPSKILAGEKD